MGCGMGGGTCPGGVDAAPQARHGAGMSTLAEIEEALPKLTSGELLRVEAVLRRIQREQGASPALKGNPRLRALDALQARLALDSRKADAWVAAVHEARR